VTDWTTPANWDVGEVVTASKLNVQIRDNLNHLYGLASLTAFDYPATCDPRENSATAAFATANHCHYNRVYHGGVISSVRLRVGTSSGNIGVAVYDTTGSGVSAAPGTRVATSGSVACPASGLADVSLGGSVTLGHGTHWFALSCSNTTATFAHIGTIPSGWTNGVNAAQATAHPPPATATPGAIASFYHILIGVP
jgi:hypothetical protein